MTENREYKSDVFSMLMETKEYALQVYNALNGSNISDPDLVEVMKLESGVSLTIRNDASFIVDTSMNIYEHQASYNPNMPLRGLIYLSELLKEYIKENHFDLFGRKKIMIPTPRFAVFYNGTEKRPEKELLNLSGSFLQQTEHPDLEMSCVVLNINPGNNQDFMKGCKVISDYTAFVEKVRENQQSMDEHSIRNAMDYCIEHNILAEFLSSRYDEVLKTMTLDMTIEARENLIRRDSYEEGLQNGIAQGIENGKAQERINAIKTAIAGGMAKEVIINVLKYTEEEYESALKVEE